MLPNLPDLGIWRRTSPFAIVFFLGTTIKAIAGGYIQLVASFGAVAYLTRFDFLPGDVSIGWVILGLAATIGAIALLRYWFFRFRLEEDRLLIRQGLLKKTALDLPFDRVQGINVERSPVDRILGLVTIRLDTAGTMMAEGRLPSVSTELADWIRTRVDGRRRGKPVDESDSVDRDRHRPERQPGIAEDRSLSPDRDRAPAHGRVLLNLTRGDMVRIGFADRKALVLAGGIAFLAQAADPVQDVIVGIVDSGRIALSDLGSLALALAVAALVLAIVAAFLVAVVVGAFLRHHDFTLWRQGAVYRSRGGLLTQREVVVETVKIQQLTLSQNLVMRWFGRYRFGALPAGAGQVSGGEPPPNLGFADTLSVPLLEGPLAEQLRSQVFGREASGLTLLPSSRAFTRVSPYYIPLTAIRIGLLPILAGLVLLLVAPGTAWTPIGIWCIAWTLLSGLIATQSWRRRGYMHDEDGLAIRRGLIGNRVDAFLFRKAQGVTVRQSPLQRRKHLATLEVLLASGMVSVPFVDHRAACSLRDYILYKVESSRLRWH